jgi:hypothetical protein
MLTQTQLIAARNAMVSLGQVLTLYHGTNSPAFFSKLCTRHGFSSNQMFMGAYSLATWVGGTAIYGPGLYLASSQVEAQSYGNLVVKFIVETTTDYLDLTGHAGTAVVQAVGVPKQNLLAEPQLYCLLKVTAQYYVLRTPYNVIVSPA